MSAYLEELRSELKKVNDELQVLEQERAELIYLDTNTIKLYDTWIKELKLYIIELCEFGRQAGFTKII
jgi:uncharacterized protein YutD